MTTTISRVLVLPYNEILKIEQYLHNHEQSEDETITNSIDFANNISMDINCYGSQDETSYAGAVLYKNGCKINMDNGQKIDEYIGKWELLDEKTNTMYQVIVIPYGLTEFYSVAYAIYKIDWKEEHITSEIEIDNWLNYLEDRMDWINYPNSKRESPLSYNEVLEEFGFNGELYASFNEFLDNEFQNEEYMRILLNLDNNEKFANMYKWALKYINDIAPRYQKL